MITAVFFDIDGTLIDPITHTVPASTIEAIRQLRAKGYKIGIASGRDMKNIELISQLDPVLFDGYVVCNGMNIYDEHRRSIYAHTFTDEQIRTILSYANQRNITLIFETAQELYCANQENHYVDIANLYYQESTPQRKDWTMEPVYKISCFADLHYDFRKLLDAAAIRIIASPTTTYDITLQHISKLSGIHELMHHWQLPESSYLCFGDHDNDLEMIQGAQLGVAVKDSLGSRSLQELADDTCLSAAEDGIYLYLQAHHFI